MTRTDLNWAADMPAGKWRDGTPCPAIVQYPVSERVARCLVADWGGTARVMTKAENAAYAASCLPSESLPA